jgi:hypothetical protein
LIQDRFWHLRRQASNSLLLFLTVSYDFDFQLQSPVELTLNIFLTTTTYRIARFYHVSSVVDNRYWGPKLTNMSLYLSLLLPTAQV